MDTHNPDSRLWTHTTLTAGSPIDSDPPYRGDNVWLCQLYHDTARAQLVTSVARVPVIVSSVAIEEGIPTPAHPLQHCSTR